MLNNAVLMGRLTSDPELRHTPSNIPVVRFTLAVERSYVAQGAERQVDFIDITAWRKTAEFVSRYFRKGMMVAVQGSIRTHTYTDTQSVKRKAFEIVAENVYFAEPKRDGGGMSDSMSAPPSYPSAPGQAPATFSNGDMGDFQEIEDDDLPF